jgi:hypothetical protein
MRYTVFRIEFLDYHQQSKAIRFYVHATLENIMKNTPQNSYVTLLEEFEYIF